MRLTRHLINAAATISVMVTTATSAGAQAVAEGSRSAPVSVSEREALAYALDEFAAIERLLAEAEGRARGDARVFLDYDAVRSELDAVKAGIRQYLDQPRPQPRTFEPLEAEYVRVSNGR